MVQRGKEAHQEIAEVMAWILELDKETEGKVKQAFDILGFQTFFSNIDSMYFTEDVKRKFKTLRIVVDAFNGDFDSVDLEGDE